MTLDLLDERALPEYLTERRETFARKPDYYIPPGVLIACERPESVGSLRLRRLISQHYRVLAICGITAVVESSLQLTPDVILVDSSSASAADFQACKHLRQSEYTRRVPILYVANSRKKESGLTALTAGANDILFRPFAAGELVLRLNHLASISQYQASLLAAVAQLQDAEAKLDKACRISTLGVTAGMIIHDLAHPVARLKNTVWELEAVMACMPDPARPAFREMLAEMRQDLDLANGIIDDAGLLASASPAMEWVSPLGLINQCLRLLKSELKGSVKVEISMSSGQLVYAQRNKLVQVLMNLIRNAAQALKAHPGERAASIVLSGSETETHSIISVRDNGPGIDPVNLNSIFEPWFTTKQSGLGLGLAICNKFMVEMGGRISVKSVPNQSCEFVLELPLKASSRHPAT